MFGVGDLTVFARPVVAAPVDKGPTFPLYLLPSFNIPFRHRRPKSGHFDPQIDSPSETSVPSLSSSPDSLSGAETPETPDSPISLRPFLTKFPALGDSHDQLNARKRRLLLFFSGPRVARTQPDTIRCSTCATDIAFSSQIVSKGFTGRHGRAFLLAPPSLAPTNTAAPSADLINITVGRPETRQLVTGLHSVADIWCAVCGTKLGWKYVDAREPSQKYKVGKFILETTRVALHQTWEDVGSSAAVRKEQFRGGTRSTSAGSSARSSSETNTDTVASGGSSSYVHDEDDDIVVFDSEDEDECDDIFAGVWDADTVVKRRRSKAAQTKKRR